MKNLKENLIELVRRTSAELPQDIIIAIQRGTEMEAGGTNARYALEVIQKNIEMARDKSQPLCQDTGSILFYAKVPAGFDQLAFEEAAREAVAESTAKGYLRQNSVDSVTGANTGNNLGPGSPSFHFEQWKNPEADVCLILKGGGCENMGVQYSLPDGRLQADRDLNGIRKCILDAVLQAQGKGCSPGAVGVCIGGDRTSGYQHAKAQLFRSLDDVNADPKLAELEASIMATVNDLDIGPMGFGGKVTLIGCKIGALNRLPASFFVSVAYDCWAFRRLGVVLDATTGAIDRWLYRDPSHPIVPMADQAGFTRTGREVRLRAPLTAEDVRSVKVGDVVMVSGRMFTGRDAVHSYLMKHEPPVDLRGSVLYHCGPVVAKEGDGWRITAAGPTTSIREEPYQGDIIERYGVRAVIGKGGMGATTLAAMKEHGAIYLNAIGGAAQFYARTIKAVDGVSLLEFGTPEAMWHLTVEDFPAIVTMDAHGNSLHKTIEQESGRHLEVIGTEDASRCLDGRRAGTM